MEKKKKWERLEHICLLFWISTEAQSVFTDWMYIRREFARLPCFLLQKVLESVFCHRKLCSCLFFRTVGSLLLGRWWGWGLRRGAALGRRAVLQPGSSSPETCDRRSQYGGCSLPLPLLIVYGLRCLKMLHNLRMGESDRAGGISMEPR